MAAAAKGGRRKKGPSTKAWLIEQCTLYRNHVRVRELATAAEIAEAWPAKGATVLRWIHAYGSFRAWIDTQDDTTGRRDRAEEVMLAALGEEPEQVILQGGQRVVKVYPKGLRALLWFRGQDWLLGWMAERLQALREGEERGELDRELVPEPVTLMRKVEDALAHELAAMAAVACHEGPGLGPDALRSDPPQEWVDLDTVELYAVNRAFFEVNGGRMEALQRIVKPTKGAADGPEARMSWTVFMGTLSMRMNVDARTLMEDHSLVKLLAQVGLANSADTDALR